MTNFFSNKSVVIYGFGIAGKWLSTYIHYHGGTVLAIVDSDEKKHSSTYLDVPVSSPTILQSDHLNFDLLINTIIDIQDIHSKLFALFPSQYLSLGVILDQLDYANYLHSAFLPDTDNFSSSFLEQTLLAVHSCHLAYLDPNVVYLRSLDVVVTERCSLKCMDCSNLMQYYTKPQNISTADIFSSIDRLLESVDYIHEFRIIGGEPFVNPLIYDILEQLLSYERVRVATLFTNATIPLNHNRILSLPLDRLIFSVTDYGTLSPRTTEYESFFRQHDIAYRIHPPEYWTDSGTIVSDVKSIDEMKVLFSECCGKNLITLINDKLYRCPFAANIENLSPLFSDPLNSVSVDASRSTLNSYLYDLDYIPACSFCKGRSYSSRQIVPAIQTRHTLPLPLLNP